MSFGRPMAWRAHTSEHPINQQLGGKRCTRKRIDKPEVTQ